MKPTLNPCRCGQHYPADRNVSHWPVIDGEDASDYCAACWRALARRRGWRRLGEPGTAGSGEVPELGEVLNLDGMGTSDRRTGNGN